MKTYIQIRFQIFMEKNFFLIFRHVIMMFPFQYLKNLSVCLKNWSSSF